MSDALLREVSVKGLVEGVTLNKSDFYHNPSLCKTCAAAKMSRRHFKATSHRAIPEKVMSLVYTDVEGPIKPVGHSGVRYVVPFNCGRSRFRTLYFMNTKDEVLDKFKTFKSILSHPRALDC